MASESVFRRQLIKELNNRIPGSIVFHADPNFLQGIPDLFVLYKSRWAALETKRESNSPKRVNQEYYVDLLNQMSYANFVYPENKDTVFDELQIALRVERLTRFLKRK